MKAVVPQGLLYNMGSVTNRTQGKVRESNGEQSKELRKSKVLFANLSFNPQQGNYKMGGFVKHPRVIPAKEKHS